MKVALVGPVTTTDLPGLSGRDLPPGFGGSPVSQLARGLLGRGIQLVIVTCDQGVAVERVFDGDDIRLRVGPYRARHRARDAFRTERAYVAAAVRVERPDVVHAHWTYEFALGALASGLPTVVTCHDWAPAVLRFLPHPYRLVRLLMQARTIAAADHLVAVSPYIADKIERWSRRSVPVIPNPLADNLFAQRERTTQPPDVVVAVNAGFTRLKNVSTLLRAFPQIRARRPSCHLLLIGPGYETGGPAETWATRSGLADGVQFVGRLGHSEVQTVMRRAAVLVHPSLEESFGMVIVEAMAQRLPVVAGDASGAVPWLLDHGRAGSLTDVRSPDSLAHAVIELLEDENRWRACANDGFTRAWHLSRSSVVSASYIECYEKVLE